MKEHGKLVPLNSLWVGPKLGYLEQLCIRSALVAGHEVRLFSYAPDELSGVPAGVEVRNAAEIMGEEKLLFSSGSGFVALDSDFWRYRLLEKGMGLWIDMDVILLQPLEVRDGFLFGWQDADTINNAVLGAPMDSPFVADLVGLPRPNHCPPWFGPRRRLTYKLRRLIRGDIGLADLPWGTFGPELVTYLVRKHRLERYVQPSDVLYPIPWQLAPILYEQAPVARAYLTENTRAVHMWHGRLGELASKRPPAGSFIAEMCERFGVEISVAQ